MNTARPKSALGPGTCYELSHAVDAGAHEQELQLEERDGTAIRRLSGFLAYCRVLFVVYVFSNRFDVISDLGPCLHLCLRASSIL